MSSQSISAALSGSFLIGGDLRVHRLGYGTMRLVGDGAWGEPADLKQTHRVLRRAVELGVTLIDTADAYGPEIAERLIGETLAPYPTGVVIGTKGGITRQGPAKTEYVGRAGYLIQCVEMSLRRLKLEQIELYQLHRIDPRTPLEESLGALRRMQEQGKIRHIGLSEVNPAEIERVVTPRHGWKNPSSAPTVYLYTKPLPGGIDVGISDGHVDQPKLDSLWNYTWHLNWKTPNPRPGLPP